MTSFRDSILLLKALPDRWKTHWSAGPFDAERTLADLASVRRELDRKVGGRRGPAPMDGDRFQRALSLWESGAAVRLLPSWATRMLCNHPDSALNPRFQSELLLHPQLPNRRAWAEGLIAAHFLHWHEGPELEVQTQGLIRILSVFPSHATWLVDIRKNVWEVLGRRAPQVLVSQMQNVFHDLDPVLSFWGLSSQQGLGKAVTLEALRVWSTQFRKRRPEASEAKVMEEIRQAFAQLVSRVPMGQPFLQTVDDVVLSEWANASPGFREFLTAWCVAHPNLGDPRQNSGNWHPIPLSKAKILSWMARRDLTFFYDQIVPSQSDDQGRKEFWLKHVDKIIDFRIAVGTTDREKIKRGQFSKNEVATLEGSPDLSAFILKFKGQWNRPDFVCVEFSHSGHALYIYDADVFEDHIAGMRAISYRATPGFRNLKNQTAYAHRQSHHANWQWAMQQYLSSRGV